MYFSGEYFNDLKFNYKYNEHGTNNSYIIQTASNITTGHVNQTLQLDM